MFSGFPAVLAPLSAIAIYFYRISEDDVRRIEFDLRERKLDQLVD